MKSIVLGIAVAGMLAGASYAQTSSTSPTTNNTTNAQPAPAGVMPRPGAPGNSSTTTMTNNDDKAAASGNNNQAVATTSANASTPAKGANSFTMGEAKNRLEKNGFADVSGLKKDDNGVWRGTGKKNGAESNVWLDYKGNTGTTSN